MIRSAATDALKPVGGLVRYDAACRALAEAKSVDEVKHLRDKAEAMRAYAHQAKNKQLEVDAAEIRIRAERRLGEMISEQKATIGLSTGSRGQLAGRDASGGSVVAPPERTAATLAEAGIDKKLSARAQKIAAVPAEQFEEMIGEWRCRVEAENERITVNLLKAGEKRMAEAAPAEPVADEDREYDVLISAWEAAGEGARARFFETAGITIQDEAYQIVTETASPSEMISVSLGRPQRAVLSRTPADQAGEACPPASPAVVQIPTSQTNSHSSPVPTPRETKATGADKSPSPSAPVVATRKPLRPYCQRPELCGGYGRNHCGPCEKAKRESEAA